MIGHNVDYDWEHLGRPACKRICTMAISRYIWPGNDAHNLGTLVYHLSSDLLETRNVLRGAHGAAVDVQLCYAVLRAQLEQPQLKHVLVNTDTPMLEVLWQFSENARIPRIWAFGKHKGKDVRQTDKGYLGWCLREPDMDAYVKKACRLALDGQLED
jgi:exodeoxyribonuclease X